VSDEAAVEAQLHAALLAATPVDARSAAWPVARRLAPLLPDADLHALIGRVVSRLRGLGPLDELLGDPSVSEVMVNAGTDVWVERSGCIHAVTPPLAPGQAEHVVERVVGPLGLRADRTSPIVDARLSDGSRFHAVLPPLAVDGPAITIRRFSTSQLTLNDFAAPRVADLLADAVRRGANAVISGATASGKTTLLNALAGCLPAHTRIVTIEDTAELRLPGDHVVRLEARPGSLDGLAAVQLRDLVRASLRMRPDRIVVGEVRGPEAFDMVQAMNTGHAGTLSTVHANSAVDALHRLEVMVTQGEAGLPFWAARELVRAAIDLIVHVARSDGAGRRVVAVGEVCPASDGVEAMPSVRLLATGEEVVHAPSRPWAERQL
jgi:pilus assembly protein CpaF